MYIHIYIYIIYIIVVNVINILGSLVMQNQIDRAYPTEGNTLIGAISGYIGLYPSHSFAPISLFIHHYILVLHYTLFSYIILIYIFKIY